jgi:hypothetical protein
MAGLFLVDQSGKLTALTQADYPSEDRLQSLLADYPDLLGGDQMGGAPRQWLFVAREAAVPDSEGSTGRWSLDHLFLDQDAIPTFVEVKRASDSRIRREVVGQMLDYAANGLRYWPVEAIQGFLAQNGTSADEQLVKTYGPDVDAGDYWRRLKENLADGKIRLLFVADRIPSELLAVVEFLNTHMSHTDVLAVEIPQFIGDGGLCTLAPRVLGQTQAARQQKESAGSRHVLSEDEFFSMLGNEARVVFRRLLDFSTSLGATPMWGSSGVSVRLPDRAGSQTRYTLFVLTTSDNLYAGWLPQQLEKTGRPPGIARDYAASLCALFPSMSLKDGGLETTGVVTAADVSAKWDEFTHVIQDLVGRLEGTD